MQDANTHNHTTNAIAGVIRAEMARRRWTQKKLRDATGWSVPFLSRRVAGTVGFSVAELVQLAAVIGADPVQILREALAEVATSTPDAAAAA
jgi:transcriptional regulator with XRE-family HTH domain